MSKKIITLALIAAGIEAFSKAVENNPADASKEIFEMLQQKDAAIEKLEKENAEILAANKGLQETIQQIGSKTEETNSSNHTFQVGENKYKFIGSSAFIKGKKMTAEDIVNDKDACAFLVKNNSELIEAI